MKRILCFGDSNTWGYSPKSGNRFEETIRWTGLLQTMLGADYAVLEEGLSGRTTVFETGLSEYHSGKAMLRCVLDTHSPIDTVVLMLGTNDLKNHLHLNAYEIACGAEQLIKIIQSFRNEAQKAPPHIVLVCPASLDERIFQTDARYYFDGETSIRVSKELPVFYQKLADTYGCSYVNADDITEISDWDAIHFTEKGHRLFAEGILPYCK